MAGRQLADLLWRDNLQPYPRFVSSYWPTEDSVFSVDRGDVVLGTAVRAVGSILLYLLVGWVAVATVGVCLAVLFVAFTSAALAFGHRGLRVVPLAGDWPSASSDAGSTCSDSTRQGASGPKTRWRSRCTPRGR